MNLKTQNLHPYHTEDFFFTFGSVLAGSLISVMYVSQEDTICRCSNPKLHIYIVTPFHFLFSGFGKLGHEMEKLTTC